MNAWYKILNEGCLDWLNKSSGRNVDITFVDPPFRQGKDYRFFDDNQPEERYWDWLKDILSKIHRITAEGGAVYLMHLFENFPLAFHQLVIALRLSVVLKIQPV